MDYSNIISKYNSKNILVIGDLLLDRYIQGSVSRISPEAPVPVVLQEKSFYTPGGAANVANNLRSLGAKVTLVGKIGKDTEGSIFTKELKEKGIDTTGIFVDAAIPTALKTRIIAQHQQVVRVDRESAPELIETDKAFHKKVLEFILKHLNDYDALIISDYGKGMITPEIVTETCAAAVKAKKIITVDPKVEHFDYYSRVTAITPNKRETENAIRNIKVRQNTGRTLSVNSDKLDSQEAVNRAGAALLEYLDLESLLITLGEGGMRLFEKGKKEPYAIKTRTREVFDVTGAGDTVISVFTLSLTAGATKQQAADLANYAAGVVVGKLGAVAVTKKELSKI